jgi:hypothetical protein
VSDYFKIGQNEERLQKNRRKFSYQILNAGGKSLRMPGENIDHENHAIGIKRKMTVGQLPVDQNPYTSTERNPDRVAI